MNIHSATTALTLPFAKRTQAASAGNQEGVTPPGIQPNARKRPLTAAGVFKLPPAELPKPPICTGGPHAGKLQGLSAAGSYAPSSTPPIIPIENPPREASSSRLDILS